MQLTTDQQRVVEANMGLVGKVIKDKVRPSDSIFSYDDLFQIGCIGLCKAAATDKGGCFSTYAYRLIWNEICDALIRATRLSQYECSIEECVPQSDRKIRPIDQISHLELQMLSLRDASASGNGLDVQVYGEFQFPYRPGWLADLYLCLLSDLCLGLLQC